MATPKSLSGSMKFNVDAEPYVPRFVLPSPVMQVKHAPAPTPPTTPIFATAARKAQPISPSPTMIPKSATAAAGSSPLLAVKEVQRPPGRIRYTKVELLRLKLETQGALQQEARAGPRLSFPPFHGIPASFAKYFQLRCYVEFVNWDSSLLLPPRPPPSYGAPPSAEEKRQESAAKECFCRTCASIEDGACHDIAELIRNVKAKEKAGGGGFLLQGGDVVLASVAVLVVFDHRRTSRKMKLLGEKAPGVKRLVLQYLCGDGFHIPPPPLANDDAWSRLIARLKFDYIRDNKTKVFTELSKNWRRSHTAFEQFAHFAFFRDAVTAWPCKGMITHSQKPVLVACVAGDVDAVVLLGEMGYFVLSDAFWDLLPYFAELEPAAYATLRHLCIYYFKRQQRQLLHLPHLPLPPASSSRAA